MFFFFVSVLAGVLTVLAPCILPLLPVVVGTADGGKKGITTRSFVVIGSLLVSVTLFTLILKASTLLIAIPQTFWAYFSGSIIVLVGFAIMFPNLWSRIPFVSKLSSSSNQLLGTGYQKQSHTGDVLVGAALGPVFTTCSPTYFFIIGVALPASFGLGLFYLFGFVLGLGVSLLLIAYFGQQLISAIIKRMGTASIAKKIFGALIVIVGIAIFTGYDKKIETAILDAGYGATIDFEQRLIDQFGEGAIDNDMTGDGFRERTSKRAFEGEPAVAVPNVLLRSFPYTDWSQADPKIEEALSGGPGKDGIPALDAPKFEPIQDFRHGDDVLAIMLLDGENAKAYPYNILNWHEIVNDEVNGIPVAVTFCPLCGSAIVFDRRVEGEETTFGVSGALLESNMLMYDRATESLWQQSTGEALAGERFGTTLDILSMQLLTIGEIRERYPDALVLSEDTGYRRSYDRNPYVGYEEDERLFFPISGMKKGYHPKEIFVVYRVQDVVAGTPLKHIEAGTSYAAVVDGIPITLKKIDGEIEITDSEGAEIPFYFEMWFSFTVQHGSDVVVYDPKK